MGVREFMPLSFEREGEGGGGGGGWEVGSGFRGSLILQGTVVLTYNSSKLFRICNLCVIYPASKSLSMYEVVRVSCISRSRLAYFPFSRGSKQADRREILLDTRILEYANTRYANDFVLRKDFPERNLFYDHCLVES